MDEDLFPDGMAQSSKMERMRRKLWKDASVEPSLQDPMKELSANLHPASFQLVITAIKENSKTVRTYRMKLTQNSTIKELPVFRAGQYLSIKVDLDEVKVTRPYSICSAPSDIKKENYYEITLQVKEDGFLSKKLFEAWKVGSIITVSGPHGTFYYEPLRDSTEIVAIAGGSGITPIRSIIREIVSGQLNIQLTLLYGSRNEQSILFEDELNELAQKSENIKIINICDAPSEAWCGPTGLIDAGFIKEYAGPIEGKTFFICGPQAMYDFVRKELQELKIPVRRIRRELYGQPDDISRYPTFPKDLQGKVFEITVRMGTKTERIKAIPTESVLVALERANIGPDSQCRSGECGFCRSLLISGKIFVNPENDGRRKGDKKFGFFHPCSSYPLSDLQIQIPSFKSSSFSRLK